jgi:hypothetical protein
MLLLMDIFYKLFFYFKDLTTNLFHIYMTEYNMLFFNQF